MIDHAKHIESVVKDELAKACAKLGIDKSEVGYAIGGFGGLMPVMSDGGPSIEAAWTLLLSLKNSRLLGQGPEGASVPIPGVLPPDDGFRVVVNLLLKNIDERRTEAFNRAAITGQGGIDLTNLKFGGKG
jgi:hypothetical protein